MKKIISIFSFFALVTSLIPSAVSAQELEIQTTLEENLDNIVFIECGFFEDDTFVPWTTGSGIILGDDVILTNAHVAFYIDEYDDLYYYDACLGGVAENSYTSPTLQFFIDPVWWNYDSYFDYAFMQSYDIVNEEVVEYLFDQGTTYGNPDSLVHGDDITLIGYPGIAGGTITTTQGIVSGFNGPNWIKTDATAEFGNSGGGAFDSLGNLIGIPTSVVAGDLNSFTYVQNLNAIVEDAFGTEVIQRDYDTLYTVDNVVCVEEIGCFNFGEGEEADLGFDEDTVVEDEPDTIAPDEADSESNGTSPEILEGQYDPNLLDESLVDRFKGYILLQVDQHGEAYYVNPNDGLRYYMKDGAVAYEMMRSFGLGITDVNLAQIPVVEDANEMLSVSSVCSSNPLANSVKGKILLQVEQHGEAYYIHPDTCYGIYMKDGNAAYDIMRFLSEGILSSDLAKMPTGTI